MVTYQLEQAPFSGWRPSQRTFFFRQVCKIYKNRRGWKTNK